jgi:AcrR family transcriptional regulator
MTAIAERAGVSPPLLYKRFGSKVALARRAYDVTLVGDQEPVPLAGRSEVAAIIAEPEPARNIGLYVRMARGVVERVGPFSSRLAAGAQSGDRALAQLVDELEARRTSGIGGFVAHLHESGALPPKTSEQRAVDIVSTLVSPAMFSSLAGRGWSNDDIERWLAALVPVALGVSPSAPPGSG